MLRTDGTGNFTSTDDGNGNSYPNGYDYASLVINDINSDLMANNPMTLPFGNTTSVEPIQFQLILYPNLSEGVHFHEVDDAEYFYSSSFANWKGNFSVYGEDVIDIYLCGSPTQTTDLKGIAEFFANGYDEIKLYDAWRSYNNGNYIWGWWDFARLLNHELGHLLGLRHSWNSNDSYLTNLDCSDTPSHSNCWSPSPPCSNNVMDYNVLKSSFTPCQLGIIHEYLTNFLPQFVETSYFSEYNSALSVTINPGENILWNSSRHLGGDVVIKSGGQLTLTCQLSLPEGAKVIVERGGKLVIDDGIITNIFDEQWSGIQVYGNPSKPHPTLASVLIGTYNDPDGHGVVILKNGATIERARMGIRNCKVDDNGTADLNYSGGVIYASNTSFIDNFKSVEYWQYEYPNIGTFTRCNFRLTNANYDLDIDCDKLVTLWNVSGVKFSGCVFENLATNIPQNNKRGYGIYSEDADYIVQGICTALGEDGCCVSYDEGEFNNLYYGIYGIVTDPAWLDGTLKIKNQLFDQTMNGIYLSGFNAAPALAEVTANEFSLASYVRPAYGLYLQSCSGYKVEGNSFTSSSTNPNKNQQGIIVNSSGDADNLVYRNTFTSLTSGTTAIGDNRETLSLGTGLRFKCNAYTTAHKYDISVVHTAQGATGTIAQYQGDCSSNTSPAGNQFSASCPQTETHLYVELPTIYSTFYSHHNTGAYIPSCYNSAYWSLTSCNVSIRGSCPSTLCSGYPNYGAMMGYGNSIGELSEMIDGGSTAKLLDDINNASLSSAQLKEILLDLSPYLSDEVLKSYINRPFELTDSDAAEVLLANSPLSEIVYTELKEKKPTIADAASIENAQQGVSAIQTLYFNIADLNAQREFTKNELAKYYIDSGLTDSVHLLLDEYGSDFEIYAYALNQNDFEKAKASLDLFPYTEQEEMDWKDFHTVSYNLQSNGQ
jgi:hypothetical protein